jgi:hypothetical protein
MLSRNSSQPTAEKKSNSNKSQVSKRRIVLVHLPAKGMGINFSKTAWSWMNTLNGFFITLFHRDDNSTPMALWDRVSPLAIRLARQLKEMLLLPQKFDKEFTVPPILNFQPRS